MRTIIIGLFTGIIFGNVSLGQNSDPEKGLELNRWSFSTRIGWCLGGPSHDMVKSMQSHGFGDRVDTWLSSGTIDYPITDHTTPSGLISFKYKFHSTLAIGIDIGYNDLGYTKGCNEVEADFNTYFIRIDYSMYNITPLFSYIPNDAFIVGIGPSVYFTKAWQEGVAYPGPEIEENHTKLGFLIDLAVRVPQRSLLFFEMNCQYRYAGKELIGPFDEMKYGLPETEVSYSNIFIGAGLGFRFGKDRN
jgi:hypothetical protein